MLSLPVQLPCSSADPWSWGVAELLSFGAPLCFWRHLSLDGCLGAASLWSELSLRPEWASVSSLGCWAWPFHPPWGAPWQSLSSETFASYEPLLFSLGAPWE